MAMESSGLISPNFSSDVTAYTASVGGETGALIIAVGRSDSTITISGVSPNGTVLERRIETNYPSPA